MANNPSPKHGSSPKIFPDRNKNKCLEDHKSQSQPDGTADDAPRGETGSRKKSRETRVQSKPGLNMSPGNFEEELPLNLTMDSAGEIGEPTGRGNFDFSLDVFERSYAQHSQAVGQTPTKKRPVRERGSDRRQKNAAA